MKKLTLFFTTSKKQGFISYIIRKVQKTPFSHVALGLKIDSLDENIVYESNIGGVVCEEKENWLKHNKIIFAKDYYYDEEDYRDVQKFCIKQLGKPYGYKNLVAILFGRTDINDKDNSCICAELAYTALKSQFDELFKNQDVVTPRDLYNYIKIKS